MIQDKRIKGLRRRLAAWRRNKSGRTSRVPEDLRKEIVVLAERYSAYRAAAALGISGGMVRRWAETDNVGHKPQTTEFVEVVTQRSLSGSGATRVIEISGPDGRLLQEQWKRLGVKVEVDFQHAEDFLQDTLRRARYTGLALFAWRLRPGWPPQSILHSREIPSMQNEYRGQNSGGWSNRDADRILEELPEILNADSRSAELQELLDIMHKEVPSIPLYLHISFSIIPHGMLYYYGTADEWPSSLGADHWF